MQLRRLHRHSPSATPFKSLAAQHLQSTFPSPTLTHINHIYNSAGTRMNIDALLKDSPKI